MPIRYPAIGGSYTAAALEALAFSQYFDEAPDDAFDHPEASLAALHRAGGKGDGVAVRVLFATKNPSAPFAPGTKVKCRSALAEGDTLDFAGAVHAVSLSGGFAVIAPA